ncbi:MAG: alanine racemase [Gammaproteobacteria bacterium]|nr:alanine racemase [Gammaproteobacteria bacterium]
MTLPDRKVYSPPDHADHADRAYRHALMHPLTSSPGILLVDLDALARNYRRLRDAAAPAECAAVVKANAYGLGVGPVARRLAREGCGRFFVASVAEGAELRSFLPQVEIYVFEGLVAGEQKTLLDAALTPVLNSLEQIDCWRRAGGGAAALHVDTGMARLGLSDAEVRELERRPQRLAGLEIRFVMTHLACADTPQHGLNGRQLERFDALRRRLPDAPTSIGNSAGLLIGRAYRGDLVRAGIALYGGSPFTPGSADAGAQVEPVVTLRGRILQLRDVAEPTTVGYGATHDAAPPCRLAVCGIGYADGYPRAAGNRCDASFRGVRVPVVGRVSMDLTCVDVTRIRAADIHVGDYVDFIGGGPIDAAGSGDAGSGDAGSGDGGSVGELPANRGGIGLDEIAAAAGTIDYEILTGLGSRLERRYVGE